MRVICPPADGLCLPPRTPRNVHDASAFAFLLLRRAGGAPAPPVSQHNAMAAVKELLRAALSWANVMRQLMFETLAKLTC